MQYWEIIADKLSAACWSWGYCSAVTPRWLALYRWRPPWRLPLHCLFWGIAKRVSGAEATLL